MVLSLTLKCTKNMTSLSHLPYLTTDQNSSSWKLRVSLALSLCLFNLELKEV